MPKFIIQNLKTQEEQEYNLPQDTIVFGRTNTCDIELPIKSISRRHAEIVREAQDYFLSDLKSGNGTFLNNQKLRPLEKNLLRSGDVIRIEDYEIRFLLAEDSPEHPVEEDTDTDILEIKLIKKMMKTLDTDETPSIEVLNGVAAGKKLLIPDSKQEVVIGRDSNADLIIDENVISRLHAKLERKWGGIVIVDLQSKNGTFVNNDRVEEKLLRDGDKVMLGTVKILYRNPKDVNLEVISQEISKKNARPPCARRSSSPRSSWRKNARPNSSKRKNGPGRKRRKRPSKRPWKRKRPPKRNKRPRRPPKPRPKPPPRHRPPLPPPARRLCRPNRVSPPPKSS